MTATVACLHCGGDPLYPGVIKSRKLAVLVCVSCNAYYSVCLLPEARERALELRAEHGVEVVQ